MNRTMKWKAKRCGYKMQIFELPFIFCIHVWTLRARVCSYALIDVSFMKALECLYYDGLHPNLCIII